MKATLALVAAVLGVSGPAHEAQAPTQASGSLLFSNSGVNYRIPRDYLTWPLSPQQPHLEVTYPDLRPAREENGCWTWVDTTNHHPCLKLDFLISGGRGPNVLQMVANSRRGYGDTLTTGTDPFGFQTWWSRDAPDYVNYFQNRSKRPLFFGCSLLTRADGTRSGVCRTIALLSDGNSASLTFPIERRNNLAEIEDSIDRLMQRFVVKDPV